MDIRPQGKIVMTCGGFDPLHDGHIELIQKAKKLGDYLIVVLNSDDWLRRKKGKNFMSVSQRKKILEELRSVDEVHVLDYHDGVDVAPAILKLRPHIFAKGGDRSYATLPEAEIAACKEVGCEMVFGVGDKIASSSELLKKWSENENK